MCTEESSLICNVAIEWLNTCGQVSGDPGFVLDLEDGYRETLPSLVTLFREMTA